MTAPARIATLDILRGVAVMGILAMNIVAFAMPWSAYFNPRAYGTEGTADLLSWFVSFVLIDGKMRGLFSLLFGASMLLVIERAEAAGEPAETVHFRRMAWLLLFGLAHFYLIWAGDILTLYAPLGMVAALFIHLERAALLRAALVALTFQTLLLAGSAWSIEEARRAAITPGADPDVITAYRGLVTELAVPDAVTLAADLALHRSGWADIAAHQLTQETITPLIALLVFGGEAIAFFLLGMWGLRSGFLTGAWEDARYRRVVRWGFAIGLPPLVAIAASLWALDFPPALIAGLGFAAALPFRVPMVLAIAALVILLTRRGGALVERIAAAGRAAFTNYLGASILMTGLFYGWGLGWYGTLARTELWLVVLAAWALMLLWSKSWLDRFRYGPFEWLWRSLARGRPQAMRR